MIGPIVATAQLGDLGCCQCSSTASSRHASSVAAIATCGDCAGLCYRIHFWRVLLVEGEWPTKSSF